MNKEIKDLKRKGKREGKIVRYKKRVKAKRKGIIRKLNS